MSKFTFFQVNTHYIDRHTGSKNLHAGDKSAYTFHKQIEEYTSMSGYKCVRDENSIGYVASGVTIYKANYNDEPRT